MGQSRKKLLYLAVCNPDLQVTGATVRMGAFIKHLSQRYDVTLIDMAGSGHRVDPAIERRSRDDSNRLGVKERVRVGFTRLGYFLFSPTLFHEADRRLKRESFDCLFVDYGLAAVYGKLLAQRYGIPLIYSSHNVEYQMYVDLSRNDIRRAVLVPYVLWAERAACRAARLVICISENDKRRYAKWIDAAKVQVIPQGFDPGEFHPFHDAQPQWPPVVLFIGNFRSDQNRKAARYTVSEIMPAVIRKLPETKFQFIGADPPSDLKGPNIECHGFVDHLLPFLQRANLVIAPMMYAHGMATKVITSLACGKTVLTTPVGASAIQGTYCGLVVAPLSEFPSRIVELLSNPPAVSEKDFKVVYDDFAWPSLMARVVRSIEQLLEAPVG